MLPTKPPGFTALSPQQQKEHRGAIGVRCRAILGQFWRDDETPDAIQAIEIEGWVDVLEGCTHSEIRAAWAEYQRSGPRTKAGKLYKPDAGALYRLAVKARPKPAVTAPPPDDREPCTPEAAEAIMKAAGFRPKRMRA